MLARGPSTPPAMSTVTPFSAKSLGTSRGGTAERSTTSLFSSFLPLKVTTKASLAKPSRGATRSLYKGMATFTLN